MAPNNTGEQQQKQQVNSATVHCRPSKSANAFKAKVELREEEADRQTAIREQITYALFEGDSEQVEKIVNVKAATTTKTTKNQQVAEKSKEYSSASTAPHKYELVWFNVAAMVALHLGAAYGAYLIGTTAHLATICWAYTCVVMGTMGVQAGAHRLWCHKVTAGTES